MTEEPEQRNLMRLSDTGLDIADQEEDIRGRMVIDRDGKEIGVIDDLYLDGNNARVRCLHVRGAHFSDAGEEAQMLIPVDAIVGITEEKVYIDQTRKHVHGGPHYDPALITIPYLDTLYGYYGFAPFWGAGYVYPPYPYY